MLRRPPSRPVSQHQRCHFSKKKKMFLKNRTADWIWTHLQERQWRFRRKWKLRRWWRWRRRWYLPDSYGRVALFYSSQQGPFQLFLFNRLSFLSFVFGCLPFFKNGKLNAEWMRLNLIGNRSASWRNATAVTEEQIRSLYSGIRD